MDAVGTALGRSLLRFAWMLRQVYLVEKASLRLLEGGVKNYVKEIRKKLRSSQ